MIPQSVTEIGNGCFYDCCNLSKVKCLSVVPPICCKSAFTNISSEAIFYVPKASIPAYQQAEVWWTVNYDAIENEETNVIGDVSVSSIKVISLQRGEIGVSGVSPNASVAFCSVKGKCLGTRTAGNGTVLFKTSEPVIIVKSGNFSRKVIIK